VTAIFESRGPRCTGVLVLSGRLDLRSALALRTRVEGLVGEGWSQLVVDLGEVAYIDSSGLGALVGALATTRRAGGDCRLARSRGPVSDLLQASTLDRVITPYSTVEDALAEYV